MVELIEKPYVLIPRWVNDLASFRRWARSAEFPEQGRISYLGGDILVDLTMETRAHNRVKTRVVSALDRLATELGLGEVYSDGMRITHPEADLSAEPDAMFLSEDSLQRQRAQFEKGDQSLEVVGAADMVLEVVSDTSETKDNVLLFELYRKAGVQEYWIVDVRKDPIRFDVYRRGAKGFVATRKQGGWVKSAVFGKSFRLTRTEGELGLSNFTLEVR
jgi:Uma2 family endonuclease